MKAEGRHLKMKPTRANSWRRTSFSDRARFTGYLVLRRSPQLFFSFPFPSLSKTRTLFPSFKRINRVYRFDGLLWNLAKMFLGYLCEKGWEPFLIFQIRLLLSALMWRRSASLRTGSQRGREKTFVTRPLSARPAHPRLHWASSL